MNSPRNQAWRIETKRAMASKSVRNPHRTVALDEGRPHRLAGVVDLVGVQVLQIDQEDRQVVGQIPRPGLVEVEDQAAMRASAASVGECVAAVIVAVARSRSTRSAPRPSAARRARPSSRTCRRGHHRDWARRSPGRSAAGADARLPCGRGWAARQTAGLVDLGVVTLSSARSLTVRADLAGDHHAFRSGGSPGRKAEHREVARPLPAWRFCQSLPLLPATAAENGCGPRPSGKRERRSGRRCSTARAPARRRAGPHRPRRSRPRTDRRR